MADGKTLEKTRFLTTTIVFVSAFALAFLLAWLIFSPGSGDQPPAAIGGGEPTAAAPTLTEADLKPFFEAVANGDFEEMDRLGGQLFQKDAHLPDSKTILAEYETNSFPPHLVYVFYSDTKDDTIYRVLLTMDENNRVASFMAEDMPIAR